MGAVAQHPLKLAIPRALSGINGLKRPSLRPFQNTARSSRNRGFTLVEILIVILIIGISLSLVVANLFVSEEERVRQEAERIMAMVERTRDQAAFSGYAIAMRLTDDGVQFMERDPNQIDPVWRNATTDTLTPRAWSQGIRVEITTAGSKTPAQIRPADDEKAPPHVTFAPTGVGVPFTMRVFTDRFERVIEGDALGNVQWKTPTRAAS
jgi:general secretion pathway protein H